jgi:Protein of unknown function (DUF2806)
MPDDQLPTIGQLVSNWLGVQLPAIPLPQTLRNIDKAIGKVILAAGANLEARIKGSTEQVKAKTEINIDELFRTDEEKRKFQNRTAATKAALEDIDSHRNEPDAQAEIEDDWLNLFVRLAEDKSSQELQGLFGRILSGEIRKPGSFSLRTLQLMTTMSRSDAETLSKLFSCALGGQLIPFAAGEFPLPSVSDRIFLEELGIASTASQIGGFQLSYSDPPGNKHLLAGIDYGILVVNGTQATIEYSLAGQILSLPARELSTIANPPSTNIDFLKNIAEQIRTKIKQRYSSDLETGLSRP